MSTEPIYCHVCGEEIPLHADVFLVQDRETCGKCYYTVLHADEPVVTLESAPPTPPPAGASGGARPDATVDDPLIVKQLPTEGSQTVYPKGGIWYGVRLGVGMFIVLPILAIVGVVVLVGAIGAGLDGCDPDEPERPFNELFNAPETPTPRIPASTAPLVSRRFEIIEVNSRITSKSDHWWIYAWQVKIKSHATVPLRLEVTINFEDKDGFILDSDVRYGQVLAAGKEILVKDRAMVDAELGPVVANIVAHVERT